MQNYFPEKLEARQKKNKESPQNSHSSTIGNLTTVCVPCLYKGRVFFYKQFSSFNPSCSNKLTLQGTSTKETHLTTRGEAKPFLGCISRNDRQPATLQLLKINNHCRKSSEKHNILIDEILQYMQGKNLTWGGDHSIV